MKFTRVIGEDWEDLYRDGVLFHEDHAITAKDLGRAARLDMDTVYADDTWLADRGTLPKRLVDVKVVE